MKSTWLVHTKRADFKAIGEKYGIDQVIARIIRNRDVVTEEEFECYINGDITRLNNPVLLKDVVKMSEILSSKIAAGKNIRIIGDYDIDGVCSIVILYKALKFAGAKVDYAVPHRITDGYGINESLIDKAIEDKIDTIITCDNGIAAISQIEYARENGLTVLVTDHHDIPFDMDGEKKVFKYPEADAVVDPKRPDCEYPFEKICGAAVAYKCMEVLFDRMNLDREILKECQEFMAIATVGDVCDLQDENRIIVKHGLRAIAKTRNIGIQSLVEVCELDINNITAFHIGFVIGPCINASGRLDSARLAIELFLCNNKMRAGELARTLKELNDERKKMTEEEAKNAIEMIENSSQNQDNVLVVYLPDCHESVAGIIAGRIREHFYKPVIVITNSLEGAKGSGRSIEGYNMFEEISACKELLTKFGGHPMAAGLSLPVENIDEFRRRLNENETLTEKELTPVTWIDVPMPVTYVTFDLVNQLSVLEPFGKGNEKPVFADKELLVRRANIIGKNKNVLKLTLEAGNGTIVDAIQFGVLDGDMPSAGQEISILYYPDINEYNGRTSLQFVVKEWR